ncbi:hypothetical protein Pan153_61600 [Gimesia panareensis]|uniref:Uncharacterized protein n=1 Tax=Gimesia panareensis TaxID=2527978 RepID=A0A518FYM6_9PLAN|nr:hypothetical protein [Gimesia panareensis]QDV21472.1 hypothetical protein Pan153_61600 [Gimesia panareensis]
MLKMIPPVLGLICCLTGVCLDSIAAEERQPESAVKTSVDQKSKQQEYEAMLYELGAFPVRRLRSVYQDPRNPGHVNSRGPYRIEFNGWLYPDVVRRNGYLNESEKERYGIPKAALPFERYLSFLDIETYEQTKDPLLEIVIQFTFDELYDRNVKSEHPGDLLKAYYPSEKWDFYFLRQLKKEPFSGPVAARLYQRYRARVVLRFLTPPESGQDEYLESLKRLLTEPGLNASYRHVVFSLLYQWDQEQYRAEYRKFLIQSTEQAPEWQDRSRMNRALLEFGGEDCFAVVRRSLVNDPIYEVRTGILDDLQKLKLTHHFLDEIQLLVLEKGKQCRCAYVFGNEGPGKNDGETELSRTLRNLLLAARQQQGLSEAAEQKIQNSLQSLHTMKLKRIGRPLRTTSGERAPAQEL